MSYTEVIKWLGPTGLILDIIGAIFIYKYGLPEEVSRTGSTNIVFTKVDTKEIEKGKRFDKWSKIGFYLLIVGFLFQLISSIKSNL
jgi:hypothetical protein